LVLEDDDPRSRIVLVSLLEMHDSERSRAIETVAASLAPGETPVFVTDDPDFRVFAAKQHLYEYLPPLGDQSRFGTPEAWEIYLANRLRILLRKWAPVRVVKVGTAFESFVLNAGRQPG
jgi:hypothetical protein